MTAYRFASGILSLVCILTHNLIVQKVLECGVKRNTGHKSASLFLSKKLRRWANGFEYGALEVKNHLERVLFSDIVSDIRIW